MGSNVHVQRDLLGTHALILIPVEATLVDTEHATGMGMARTLVPVI